MDTLAQDLRWAVRTLRRSPGFVAVAVLAMAVGIGANTALFSVVHGVLQALPYPGAERLVLAYEDTAGDGSGRLQVAPAEYLALDASEEVFEQVAAYRYTSSGLLQGEPVPELVPAVRISHDFLDLLGVRPLLGRDFAESDLGGEPVILIGYEVWQRRWNGDPGIVGRQIVVSQRPFTVIGVTPPEFTYFNDGNRLFLPLELEPGQETNNSLHNLILLARYREGLGFEAAGEAAAGVAARAQELGEHRSDRPTTVRLHSLYEEWVGGVRQPLLVFMGSVGLLLLIACSNVANLQVARGLGRDREVAVRLAVGAGRGRIVRQLVTESSLLALAGGAIGVLAAWLSMGPLRAFIATRLPRADQIQIDPWVLGFAVVVSLVAGIASGLAPAWMASRQELSRPLSEGGLTVAGSRRGQRLRGAFLVLQVSLALVLAVGAGLLVRTFGELQRVDLGFEPEGAVTARFSLGGRPEYDTRAGVVGFFDELLARLRAASPVEAAGLIDMLPGTRGNISDTFAVDAGPLAAEPFNAGRRFATGGAFEALGLPLLAGRTFTEGEGGEGTAPVAIVSEALARRLWPDDEALGKQIRRHDRRDPESVPWATVVGVVGDIKTSVFGAEVEPVVYFPFHAAPSTFQSLVVRAGGAPAAAIELVRAAVREIDPGQPLADVASLEEAVSRTYARQRVNAVLASLLAAIALLLAAVGEYAVIQHLVAQRAGEIGIRRALGARGVQVVTMVLRQGLVMAFLGLGAGLAAAWAASRFLESMLFGVRPTDPATYAAVAVFLVAVAGVACLAPALRAARIDPVGTLRRS